MSCPQNTGKNRVGYWCPAKMETCDGCRKICSHDVGPDPIYVCPHDIPLNQFITSPNKVQQFNDDKETRKQLKILIRIKDQIENVDDIQTLLDVIELCTDRISTINSGKK